MKPPQMMITGRSLRVSLTIEMRENDFGDISERVQDLLMSLLSINSLSFDNITLKSIARSQISESLLEILLQSNRIKKLHLTDYSGNRYFPWDQSVRVKEFHLNNCKILEKRVLKERYGMDWVHTSEPRLYLGSFCLCRGHFRSGTSSPSHLIRPKLWNFLMSATASSNGRDLLTVLREQNHEELSMAFAEYQWLKEQEIPYMEDYEYEYEGEEWEGSYPGQGWEIDHQVQGLEGSHSEKGQEGEECQSEGQAWEEWDI
jgi:hypothetical protein